MKVLRQLGHHITMYMEAMIFWVAISSQKKTILCLTRWKSFSIVIVSNSKSFIRSG